MCGKKFSFEPEKSKKNNGNFCNECYSNNKMSAFFEEQDGGEPNPVESEVKPYPQINWEEKMKKDSAFQRSQKVGKGNESQPEKTIKCLQCGESYLECMGMEGFNLCPTCISMQRSISDNLEPKSSAPRREFSAKRVEVNKPPSLVAVSQVNLNRYEDYLLDRRMSSKPIQAECLKGSVGKSSVLRSEVVKMKEPNIKSTILVEFPG